MGMKRYLMALALILSIPAMAQSLQVTLGSSFGINAGVRFPLVPLLVDGRAYAGYNPFGSGALGGGVDVLAKIPLTDLYTGGGAFFGTGPAISLLNQGNYGVRGVVGTYLNLGLPLLGFFLEVYPTIYLGANSGFGLGGALGVNIGF